jgi:uncharacterized protein (DUF488 family)
MKKNLPPLFTIGYEKAALRDVLRALKQAKITLVIDTRAIAASRRAGFSKRMLAASLEEEGIKYLHLQKLGTPSAGREAARAGDLKKLWGIYNKHIRTAAARAELDELESILCDGRRVALLCYEREPNECHRSRIAKLIHARTGQPVEHLFASPLGI